MSVDREQLLDQQAQIVDNLQQGIIEASSPDRRNSTNRVTTSDLQALAIAVDKYATLGHEMNYTKPQ